MVHRYPDKQKDTATDYVAQMMSKTGPKTPSYDRTWDEIEEMLNQAIHMRNTWLSRFEKAKGRNDRQVMKDAARNCKALEGVIKTLKWTIGTPGVDDPLS